MLVVPIDGPGPIYLCLNLTTPFRLRGRMAKRILLTLGVAVLVISGLGFAKYRQIQGAIKGSHFEPPPEAITSVVAKPVRWPATNTLVGTAVAVHGVTVSADLPGKIDKILF